MVSNEALYTFTFLNLADISTTIIALQRGGYEANPIARYLIKKLGLKSLFAFKYLSMGIMLFISFIISGDVAERTIWLWNIILSLVVAWNSYINYKLYIKK